jgi:isopenicillin N synthase-like dioxygenase
MLPTTTFEQSISRLDCTAPKQLCHNLLRAAASGPSHCISGRLDWRPMSLLNVPTIDISGLPDNAATVHQIGQACQDWGFFQVTNHGIDPQLRQRFLAACDEFFHGPAHIKHSVMRSAANPMGFYDQELTKNVRDWKEIFDYGADWRDTDQTHQSQWPRQWPEFQPTLEAWFTACETLSLRLMTAIAEALDLPPQALLDGFNQGHTSFARLNYYPLCDQPLARDPLSGAEQGHLGISPHTDSGALTVLVQDQVAALQVYRDDCWHTIHPAADGLIINIGDMLQVWSNDRLRAPEHRVLASSTQERFSAPFFFNPANNTLVQPVACSADNPARYRPINWGDFRSGRAAGDYTDQGEEIQISQFRC